MPPARRGGWSPEAARSVAGKAAPGGTPSSPATTCAVTTCGAAVEARDVSGELCGAGLCANRAGPLRTCAVCRVSAAVPHERWPCAAGLAAGAGSRRFRPPVR